MSLFGLSLLKPFRDIGEKAGAKLGAKINQSIIGKKRIQILSVTTVAQK